MNAGLMLLAATLIAASPAWAQADVGDHAVGNHDAGDLAVGDHDAPAEKRPSTVVHAPPPLSSTARDSLLVPTGRYATLEGAYPLVTIDSDHPASDTLDLATLRGKTVLLDFWASWCRPCVEEIPETNAFAAAFADRDDFVFVSVNQDSLTGGGDAEYVRTFARERGIEYLVLLDGGGSPLKSAFRIRAWPTRIMIDPGGEILKRPSGRLTLHVAAEYLRRQ